MKNILDRYIDRVLVYANRPEPETEEIRREMTDHLLQKIEDLVAGGMAREEAMLEAIRQHGSPKKVGYGLRGSFSWIDVRSQGTARGFIAIGPKAVGVFAFGGMATGVVAMGGLATGLISIGGCALGLLFAWGGLGVGGMVFAGFAMGVVAVGGCALGLVAEGGTAIGLWVHHSDWALSYYNAQTVPQWLKTLGSWMNFTSFWNRCAPAILLFYAFCMGSMGFLQRRESKRVRTEDDWLIDG